MLKSIYKLLFPNISYTKSGIINASQPTIYNVISQTDQYSNFISFIDKSIILKKISPYQNYTQLTISYNKFKQLSYTSHVKMKPPTGKIGQICSVESICRDQPLEMLESLWVIQARDDGRSFVSYRLEFQFRSKLYTLASSILKDYLGQQLWNIFQKQSLIQQNNQNNQYRHVKEYYKAATMYYNQDKNENKSLYENTDINKKHNINQNIPQSNPTTPNPTIKTSPSPLSQNLTQNHPQQNQQDKLTIFLNKHPQIKNLFNSNKQLNKKIISVHRRLQNLSNYEEKMRYQVNNILTHF